MRLIRERPEHMVRSGLGGPVGGRAAARPIEDRPDSGTWAQVWSSTAASPAFFLTDSMPFSAEALLS